MRLRQTRSVLDLDIDAFLERHWQREPLCLRNAVRGPQIARTALFELATRALAPSRIATLDEDGKLQRLRRGPFRQDELSVLEARSTLLVQECDRHLPACRALAEVFRFVPNWRLDDVMLSWAGNGGGIGLHADRYDVAPV